MLRLNEQNKMMLFGTREHMEWIPMPRIDADISGIGWSTKVQYLDGRAFVRRSDMTHREYNFAWNLASREKLQPIYDFYNGIYGPAPYYFIDPFSADTNVLPQWLAAPGMALTDAPTLVGESRPQRINNSDFSSSYPSRGATYLVDPSMPREKIWVPIPPATTLWFGAHGPSNDGAYLQVTPFKSPTFADDPVLIANLPVSTQTRCNYSFSSDEGYVGAEITVAGTGSLSLFGVIAQILKKKLSASALGYGEDYYGEGMYGGSGDLNGPRPGGFVGGQGHAGCEFQDSPTRQGYASALDLIGASAILVETTGGDL